MSEISIEGMEFFAYHGCMEEEAIIGTRFLVDVYLNTNTSKAEESDNLHHTVNYQAVFLLIQKEMQQRSNLLEHVGRRILNTIKKEFPQVLKADLKISKMNPPLGGRVNRVSLSMSTQ